MAGTANKSEAKPEAAGPRSGIVWILAGLIVTGLVAGYKWWRRLPK